MTRLHSLRRALLSAVGRSVIDSGVAGANAVWSLYSDGTLEISGSGNWTLFDDWNNEYNELVNSIVFKNINTTALSATIRNTLNLFTNCKDLHVDTSFTGVFGTNYPLGIPFENLHYSGTLSQWCSNVDGHRTNADMANSPYNLYINNELLSGNIEISVNGANGRFRYVKNITSVTFVGSATIPSTLEFQNCPDLESAICSENASFFSNSNVFNNCKSLTSVVISDVVNSISSRTFYDCTNLALTELPSGLTSIGSSAFNGCTSLALTELPSSLTSIGSEAFYGCKGLQTITFNGTPTTLSSSAFSHCNNLLNIYVPWEEGAVAGAPWGATKATIHYNTTYDANGNQITEV